MSIFSVWRKQDGSFYWMPHRDTVSWTTLIDGYSQRGCVVEASQVFEWMPERNSFSWNAIIAAYAGPTLGFMMKTNFVNDALFI